MKRKLVMATTDVAFAIYWILTAVGLVSVGGSAHVVAWNWSFLPLDAPAIAAGLAWAIMPKNHPASMPVLAAALTLTHAAGLLAISCFALTGPWDVTWWLVNLWLMLMPIGIAVSTIVVSLKTRRTRRLLVPASSARSSYRRN